MPALEQYEAAARTWDGKGRPASLLVAGRELVALRLWARGRKESSRLLRAHLRASEKAQPAGWLDAELAQAAGCAICKTPYHVENLLLCTRLAHVVCHDCANGSRACACGGELVG
jgi:hypothetical protein